MDYIQMGKLHKHPNELIEITIIKEYLIKESDKIQAEIYRERENAEVKNIPSYLIVIFEEKLEERKKLIRHLLDSVIDEYWDIKKKHDIV